MYEIGPDSIWSPEPILHLGPNKWGKDWVFGDPHGRNDLIRDFMREVRFDAVTYRAFSAGDNIDRGPDGLAILRRTNSNYFFSVRGNHEQILLDLHYERMIVGGEPVDPHVAMYGARKYHQEWFMDLTTAEQREALELAYNLPLIIEIETDNGIDAIVHAETPRGMTWKQVTTAIRAKDIDVWNQILWNRERITREGKSIGDLADHQVEGIHRIWHGHNPLKRAQKLGNLWFLDTAAYKRGLTVVDTECKTDMFINKREQSGPLRIIS